MMSEELKPLAWLVKHEMHGTEVTQQQCTEADRQYGWTETPLYTFEQLQGFNRLVDHPPTSNPVVDHETGNTSDKLRDAMEVWWQAETAFEAAYTGDGDQAQRAAAAIIEADREAVRAEQAAEVERLTLTVRKLQGHQAALESYLREIRDKPVARSSDAWKRHCLKLQAIAAEALGDVA